MGGFAASAFGLGFWQGAQAAGGSGTGPVVGPYRAGLSRR
ncbi:hypothetical protein UO65_2125 [Actinokineospora spheciospongiae]|uniref:Uncharacterized protein n=1 Tax=Actinokineospora spheciospongiae TaxID=909613 RepID=W7INQ9_9PSEU|nr:hypothetical protein UO65_2125 [Actinokineospora spheciospongiae]